MAQKARDIKERFWEKVEKTDTCWVWKGSIQKNRGYGVIWITNKKKEGAHRLSLILHGKKLPPWCVVMHKCDNPSCVNPNHLKFGTPKDNCDDKERKRRGNHPRGEASGLAKLNEKSVHSIRRDYPRQSSRTLAKKYNVSHKTILAVVNRKAWSHI
jgi:hypothetical protein